MEEEIMEKENGGIGRKREKLKSKSKVGFLR
jgi:hypothetical protein